ncbi:MAG: phosphoribosylanthranilate isomerase [bacterium]
MVKIKICGITNYEDAQMACALGADAIGFIFYPSSPRYIPPAAASKIINKLPPFVTKVGVFVNMRLSEVEELVVTLNLNLVQLHGEESPEYCSRLAFPCLKAVRLQKEFDLAQLSRFRTAGFLLDTFDNQRLGGTGKTFDWSLARRAVGYGPIVLAGGLTAENVAQAIQTAEPYGVDVCSGVEAAPGKKDAQKLGLFFEEIRKYEQNHK